MITDTRDCASRRDLGERSDIGAVDALMSLTGMTIVDVGCGPGKLARELRDRDATVVAVEPDPIQAEKNRAVAMLPRLRFTEARAEALPLASGSIDGVFFFRSLHHVPVAQMDAALTEAARVLKPGTGFLCVVEPAITGSHFAMMRPFHDETRVRHEAQLALERTAKTIFKTEQLFSYMQYPWYASFEAMASQLGGSTFNSIRREKIYTDEVRGLFDVGQLSVSEKVSPPDAARLLTASSYALAQLKFMGRSPRMIRGYIDQVIDLTLKSAPLAGQNPNDPLGATDA